MRIKTEEEFWNYVEENPHMAIVFDILDRWLEEAEKAHPLLPDNVIDFVVSGVSLTKRWLTAYYLPTEKIEEILDERINAWTDYYETVWNATEKLNSLFASQLEVTPEEIKKAKPWIMLMYSPTDVRKAFEKTKQLLMDCESLECILEKLELVEGE